MDSKTLVVVLILGIWLCAAIACVFCKNSAPIGAAAFISVLIGIAYCLRH